METKATRDGYGEGLLKLGDNTNVVALDADLSNSTKSDAFAKKYPDRFFSMGISEADMVCTAAGLASCGKIPFASTFSCFLMRAVDQILVSVAYSNMNVKLVGSHSGISSGEDGPSAQSIIDVGCFRSMPNMSIISPGDAIEAAKATVAMAEHKGPVYLRTARPKTPIIFENDYDFKIGRGVTIKDGNDVSIISTGIMLSEALTASQILEKEGISAEIINMPTIKPLDEAFVKKTARKTGHVITCEDHNVIGGLGSAVSECLSKEKVLIERVGLRDMFAESGTHRELYKKYGLDDVGIVNAVKSILEGP